jgi:hypothetical protein
MTIRWVPTELDPSKMIAVPTLEAVRAVLRGQAEARSRQRAHGGVIEVRVDDHPPLTEVGGVARIDRGPAGGVAVARIGRTSFVAYRLDAGALHELPVAVDATAGTLSVEVATGR